MALNKPTPMSRGKLWNVCEKFIKDQRISCPEAIHQTDCVIENAYEFIEEVCKVVGYSTEEG